MFCTWWTLVTHPLASYAGWSQKEHTNSLRACMCVRSTYKNGKFFSSMQMRGIVRDIVTDSLQTVDGFVARVVSLACGLSFYMTQVDTYQIPAWVVELKTDLTELQGDNKRLHELAGMAPTRPVRKKLDARIIDACTRNSEDTSSEEGEIRRRRSFDMAR